MPTFSGFAPPLLLPPVVAPPPAPGESLPPHADRARAAVETTAAHFITRRKGVSLLTGGTASAALGTTGEYSRGLTVFDGEDRRCPNRYALCSTSASTATRASRPAPIGTAASSTRRSPWCRSYVGPPGVRTPSRAIAPGTRSRYQAKSSPPRLCSVPTTPEAPTTAVPARVSSRAADAVFTTGGTPRWYCSSAVTPYGATTCDTSSVTSLRACSQARTSSTRSVPPASPRDGTTLRALPART